MTIVELLNCCFGVTDGWFDDPIGLSVRAYIFVPPIALGKSLLAQPYLIPWIKLLPDPQAYASSPYWPLLSLPSHTLTPHSGTSMPLRSTLTRRTMIGHLNHGVVFSQVLILL